MINLSSLSKKHENNTLSPRDIFMSLSERDAAYKYPRDVQAEVWKAWTQLSDKSNSIIKMNTGSGKTVVGLILLKYLNSQGARCVVYFAPTKNLVEQVCSEAKKLGLNVTTNQDDYLFISGNSILVCPIHKLFNGQSVFGTPRKRATVFPQAILLDDVHACLEIMKQQFKIQIKSDTTTYDRLITLFYESNNHPYKEPIRRIKEEDDQNALVQIPFYVWQRKCTEIGKILRETLDEEQRQFNYELLDDIFDLCVCTVSQQAIEIIPRCLPSDFIQGYRHAQYRLFMSATLAEDDALVTALGLKSETLVKAVITPEKADDLGERLIVFPQVLNPKVSDDEVAQHIYELSKEHNVAVIVPSKWRADWWKSEGYADIVVTKDNISKTVSDMKSRHVGCAIFINRYEGIDLPDDACRVIVIDGIPEYQTMNERYLGWSNCDQLRSQRIKVEKIEQGMGRGIRSGSDYCAVVLMQRNLADLLIRNDGARFFSEATRAQFNLSKGIWDLLVEENNHPTVQQSFELIDLILKRDQEWIRISRECVNGLTYEAGLQVDNDTIRLREAFDSARDGNHSEAAKIMNSLSDMHKRINNSNDGSTDALLAGFYLQLAAEYTNFDNQTKAQEMLLAAHKLNKNVIRPIEGIVPRRLQFSSNKTQLTYIYDYFRNESDTNNLRIGLEAILENLTFATSNTPDRDSAERFEDSIKKLGELLGFLSSRPEKEEGSGPDNLWAIGEGHYLIIECKSNSVSGLICKSDCNQLNGSINWFKNHYSNIEFTYTPVLIHPSPIFDKDCSPDPLTRIITQEKLDKLKDAVRSFMEECAQIGHFSNPSEIGKLIATHNLSSGNFIAKYSTGFHMKH